MVLRFLLNDNEEMSYRATEIIESGNIVFTNEVAAEVVYVLTGVYNVNRGDVSKALFDFIEIVGVIASEHDVLSCALKFFAESSLDFVDCLLCAYNVQYGYEVCTFDKRLTKFLQNLNAG